MSHCSTMQCAGVASGVLNLINGLTDGLLPSQLTGAGTPFTISITKDNNVGPTPVIFPQPAFSNVAGITITANGTGSVPSLLGLSLDQVCLQIDVHSCSPSVCSGVHSTHCAAELQA